jgi:uncharacterized membrane protein
VIPIKPRFPVESLPDELSYNSFPILMYFLSFLLLFGIWRHHTLLFDRLEFHDETVLWLNLVLLLLVTFVPYPLTILGDFPNDHDAMLLCVVTFVLVALVQTVLVAYTGQRDAILAAAWQNQGRAKDDPVLKMYRRMHDLAIAIRVNTTWVLFLVAFFVGLIFPAAGLATLLVLIVISPFTVGPIERKVFGLAPITRFLAAEVAMDRVLGFSDGVFSISMTLVVLDITGKDRLKQESLQDANGTATSTLGEVLAYQGDKYTAYAVSFSLIALIWTVNNSVLGNLRNLGGVHMGLLSVSLSAVGFTPFLSSLLTEYAGKAHDSGMAVAFVSMISLTCSVLQLGLWEYSCRRNQHRHLALRARESATLRRAVSVKAAVLPVCLAVPLVVGLISDDGSFATFCGSLCVAVLAVLAHSVYYQYEMVDSVSLLHASADADTTDVDDQSDGNGRGLGGSHGGGVGGVESATAGATDTRGVDTSTSLHVDDDDDNDDNDDDDDDDDDDDEDDDDDDLLRYTPRVFDSMHYEDDGRASSTDA